MIHKTEIRVRWHELDREDIVYFGNYFQYFTTAEEEFLSALGINYNTLRDKYNVGLTRVEAQCRYIRPIVSEDLIEIHTEPELEGRHFLTLNFRIFRKQDQSLLAKGKIRTACVVLKPEFKLKKFPQDVFERLTQFIS